MYAQKNQERFSMSQLYFGSWRPLASQNILWISCIHHFTKESESYYGEGELKSPNEIAHILNLLTGKAIHFKMMDIEDSSYWLSQITLFVGRLVLLGRTDLRHRFLKLQDRHQCLESPSFTKEITEIKLVLMKMPSPERKSSQDLFKAEFKSPHKRTTTPPPTMSTPIQTMTPKQLIKMDLEELKWIHSPSGLKELSTMTNVESESEDEVPSVGLLKCT
jgi:hypothetical protein